MKLPNIFKFYILLLFLFPVIVFAQGYEEFSGDVTINAAVTEDMYSTVEVLPSTVEIMEKATVIVTLRDSNLSPLVGHYIQLKADGLVFNQPLQQSNSHGKIYVEVYATTPGTYGICAEDITYEGLIIDILDCDTLYVTPVSIPALLSEPYYTKGTSNSLFWSSIGSSYHYYVEMSEESDFSIVKSSSGWVSGTMFQFTNLVNERMYFYRVKARNYYGGESNWSNVVFSVQDAEKPTIEILSISGLEDNNTVEWESNFVITFEYRVKDNLSLEEVEFFCIRKDNSKSLCGHTVKSGVLYTTTVKLSQLEKQSLNTLFKEYGFCIKASDTAGNINDKCDISVTIPVWEESEDPEEKVKPPDEVPTYVRRRFTDIVDSTRIRLDDLFSNIDVDRLTGIGATTALATFTIGLTTLLGSLFYIPMYISQIFFNILSWLGLRGKGQLSGFVYDSSTKSPVAQAIVRVYSKKGGLVWTDVTDSRGRFTLSLKDGIYKIEVSASNYKFPSKIVFGKSDYPLDNIYHGDYFEVKDGVIPDFSIPIDPEELSTFRKFSTIFRGTSILVLKVVGLLFFIFGLTFSIYAYYTIPNTFNFFLIVLYIPFFVLIIKALLKRDLSYGIVKLEEGESLKGIPVGLKDEDYKKVVSKRVTDGKGRYRFVVNDGEYKLEVLDAGYEIVRVEKEKKRKLSDGSFLIVANIVVKAIDVEN